MTAKARPWLTMTQAAAFLGETDPQAGRRLKWRLLAIQRAQRCKVLVVTGGRGKGARYATSVTLLRRWCPELFASRDHLPAAIQEALSELHEADSGQRNRIQALGGAIKATNKRLARVEAALGLATE